MPRLSHPAFAPQGAVLSFEMDGVRVEALEGETIAAALIASGRHSFRRDRDGRPRGYSCGMGVCFECEVCVDGGTPVRACLTRARAGMRVRSSSYEKSPARVPVAPGDASREVSSDVVIVGAGPAGMSAALYLAEAGATVTLLDERTDPGGQYYKPLASSQAHAGARAADAQYREGLALRALHDSSVRVMSGVTVWGAFRDGDAAFEVAGLDEERRLLLKAPTVILATGAYEPIPPVPGCTLPGVMTTGAAQGLARAYRVAPGERVVVAGNGPLNLQLACELLDGGVQLVAVAEAAPLAGLSRIGHGLGLLAEAPSLAVRGVAWLARLKRCGVPLLFGHHVARVDGEDSVEAVTLARLRRDGRLEAGTEKHFVADTVCLGYGLQPTSELARALGARFEAQAPGLTAPLRDEHGETSVPGVFVVGDGAVLGGAHVAASEGRIAARAIAARLGLASSPGAAADRRRLRRMRRFQHHLWSFYAAPLCETQDEDALLCRCESVPLRRVQRLLDEGVSDFGTLKRSTRVAMGACQGRYCQRSLARLVAAHTGATPRAEQLFEARLPVKPVPIGCLAVEAPEWAGYRPLEGDFAPKSAQASRAVETLEAEVLVIGAGVIGLSTALRLAEAGVDVLVVDAGEPSGEASGANAGSLHGQMLSSDFSSDAADSPAARTLALQRLGIEEWQSLERDTGADFELSLSGGLVVASTPEALSFLERKVDVERRAGLDVELLGPEALRERLPLVAPDVPGAAYCATEGKINPLLAGPALHAAALRAGARIRTPCAIHAIEVSDRGFSVQGASARIQCGRVVNAAGGWAAGVAGLVGPRLPVRTAPQQMIVTEPVEAMIPLLVAAAGRHLTLKQVANGNVIIGGGWPAGFDASRGRALNLRASIEGNLWVAQRIIPALGGVRMLRSWATVGVMIDGAPILGEHPGCPGFFNAVGANGYTMGPIMGRITADLALGREPPLNISAFLVDRFR